MGDYLTTRVGATSEARAEQVTGRQLVKGTLSLDSDIYQFDNGDSVYIAFDGGYVLRLDRNGYQFMPAVALFGYSSDYVNASAGIFPGKSVWQDERVLGAKSLFGPPQLNLEIYGGAKMIERWEGMRPSQDFENYIAGATASGRYDKYVGGRFNYEHEFATGAKTVKGSLSYMLTLSPGWDRMMIFSGGKFMMIEENGHNIEAGLRFNFLDNKLAISASFVRADLPPMFDIFEDAASYEDNRGKLSAQYRAGDVAVTGSVEASENQVGVRAGIEHPNIIAYGIYRNDHQIGTNAVGGVVNGRVKLPGVDDLVTGPFATFYYEEGSVLSPYDQGLTANAGTRVTAALTDWLTVSAQAGYESSRLAGDGLFAGVNIIAGDYIIGDEEDLPGGRTVRPLAFFPSEGEITIRPAGGNSALRATLSLPDHIPHKSHFEDETIQESLGRPALCGDCHTFGNTDQKNLHGICFDCHDESEKKDYVDYLQKSVHPFEVNKDKCEVCHPTIRTREEAGTQPIFTYPHADKKKMQEEDAWVGHGAASKDGSCGLCHNDVIKYEGRTLKSCKPCHEEKVHRERRREPGKEGWADHGLAQDGSCGTCHDGSAKARAIASAPVCDSCHDSLTPNMFASGIPHLDGWRGAPHVMEAKMDLDGCTTCHTSLSSCRSCHTSEGVMPANMHVGTGFISGSEPGYSGVIGTYGDKLCSVCHTPSQLNGAFSNMREWTKKIGAEKK